MRKDHHYAHYSNTQPKTTRFGVEVLWNFALDYILLVLDTLFTIYIYCCICLYSMQCWFIAIFFIKTWNSWHWCCNNNWPFGNAKCFWYMRQVEEPLHLPNSPNVLKNWRGISSIVRKFPQNAYYLGRCSLVKKNKFTIWNMHCVLKMYSSFILFCFQYYK